MIRTEFFDEFDRITTPENAKYLVCIVIDSSGKIMDRKTVNLSYAERNEFQTRTILEHHWENAISIQKIIDNLWSLYHSTKTDELKLGVIEKLLQSYDRLDHLFDRLESREFRRRRRHE